MALALALAAMAIEQPTPFHKQFAAHLRDRAGSGRGPLADARSPREVNLILDAFLRSLT